MGTSHQVKMPVRRIAMSKFWLPPLSPLPMTSRYQTKAPRRRMKMALAPFPVLDAVSAIGSGDPHGANVQQSNAIQFGASTSGPNAPILNQSPKALTLEAAQTNENETVYVDTSVAVADDVSVTNNGPIDAGNNGINAVSKATADASIVGSVSQANDTQIVSRTTAGPADTNTPPNQINGNNSPITQTQTVYAQTNENEQISVATRSASLVTSPLIAKVRSTPTTMGLMQPLRPLRARRSVTRSSRTTATQTPATCLRRTQRRPRGPVRRLLKPRLSRRKMKTRHCPSQPRSRPLVT